MRLLDPVSLAQERPSVCVPRPQEWEPSALDLKGNALERRHRVFPSVPEVLARAAPVVRDPADRASGESPKQSRASRFMRASRPRPRAIAR